MNIILTALALVSIGLLILIIRLNNKVKKNEINLMKLTRICDLLANEMNKSLNSIQRFADCMERMFGISDPRSNWKDAENIK